MNLKNTRDFSRERFTQTYNMLRGSSTKSIIDDYLNSIKLYKNLEDYESDEIVDIFSVNADKVFHGVSRYTICLNNHCNFVLKIPYGRVNHCKKELNILRKSIE